MISTESRPTTTRKKPLSGATSGSRCSSLPPCSRRESERSSRASTEVGPEVIGRKLLSRLARSSDRRSAQGRAGDRPQARALRSAGRGRRALQLPRAGDPVVSLAAATASDEEARGRSPPPEALPRMPERVRRPRPRHAFVASSSATIAGLLPIPVVDRLADDRPVRGFLIDWISRPFSGDRTALATHAATSGTGRGLGSVAAVKLASLCIGGAALTGGAAFCVAADGRAAAHASRAVGQATGARDRRAGDPDSQVSAAGAETRADPGSGDARA